MALAHNRRLLTFIATSMVWESRADHWPDCSFVTHFSCPDEFVSRRVKQQPVQDEEEGEKWSITLHQGASKYRCWVKFKEKSRTFNFSALSTLTLENNFLIIEVIGHLEMQSWNSSADFCALSQIHGAWKRMWGWFQTLYYFAPSLFCTGEKRQKMKLQASCYLCWCSLAWKESK